MSINQSRGYQYILTLCPRRSSFREGALRGYPTDQMSMAVDTQSAKLSIISGARYYWFRSTTIQNYHHRLKYLVAQLHPTAQSIICPWGLSARGRLGLHDVCLAWSILEAGSQQSPELLCINGIRYPLLQPPRQRTAMEVPSVDSTEVMHSPQYIPGSHPPSPVHSPYTSNVAIQKL